MKKKMVALTGRKFPYARLKGMEELMAFIAEPQWRPARIDTEVLRKLAVAKGKEREAVAALRFLGVIDDDGAPTHLFDALKTDYRATMRTLVEQSYAELFSMLPARLANQVRLVNFFGGPLDTAEYQAKFFVWCCQQCGIELPTMEKNIHRTRFDKPTKGQAPVAPTKH
jgi:hypothetical protein